MKFTTIATSVLACSSIFSSPVNHEYRPNSDSLATKNTQSTTTPYEIRQFINAGQIYDKIQEIAKIPKDQFVEKVNEGIGKFQKVLDIFFDFGKRLDNLTSDQKQQLNAWWTQIAPKYQQPLPKDPTQLKQIILPDLKQFLVIIYQMDADQTFRNMKNYIDS